MTMNSSHTPMLHQQWAILPEWAIGTVVGFVVVTIGAIASRRHMSTAVVVVLCLVGIGIVLVGAVLSIGIGVL